MPAGSCVGICKRVTSFSYHGVHGAMYPKCRQCEIAIDTTNLRCPCCGNKLSTRIRGSSRRKFVDNVSRIS